MLNIQYDQKVQFYKWESSQGKRLQCSSIYELTKMVISVYLTNQPTFNYGVSVSKLLLIIELI